MLGGQNHVSSTKESVRTSGENGNIIAFDIEGHFGTFTAANPIALQSFDRFRPIKRFEFINEALSIFCDAEHPLTKWATLNRFSFFLPLFDFLIREDSSH